MELLPLVMLPLMIVLFVSLALVIGVGLKDGNTVTVGTCSGTWLTARAMPIIAAIQHNARKAMTNVLFSSMNHLIL
jgi:hypothetical protein